MCDTLQKRSFARGSRTEQLTQKKELETMKTKQIAIKENGHRRKVTALAVSSKQWDNLINVFETGAGENYMYSHGPVVPVENYEREDEKAMQLRLYLPTRAGANFELHCMLGCVTGEYPERLPKKQGDREAVAWVVLDSELDEVDETKRLINEIELHERIWQAKNEAEKIGSIAVRVDKYRELVGNALKKSIMMPFLPATKHIFHIDFENKLYENGAYQLVANYEYVKDIRPYIRKNNLALLNK